ncbi:MAG: hypothetical protein J5I81_00135, partial [Nitrococcus mobilis]|nr:hypothetical protein [Nitrococcus mobilis]
DSNALDCHMGSPFFTIDCFTSQSGTSRCRERRGSPYRLINYLINYLLINYLLVIPTKTGQIRSNGFEQLQPARRAQTKEGLRDPVKSIAWIQAFAGATSKSDAP